jgi:hypothetical protein
LSIQRSQISVVLMVSGGFVPHGEFVVAGDHSTVLLERLIPHSTA